MSFCVNKAISRRMLLTKREIDWRIFDDVARDCINVIAETKPVESTRFIKREGHQSIPCSWTSSWWARLIKWCITKKYLHRLIPYPIECLACATEVTTAIQTDYFPEQVTSCIVAQMARIRMDGREPKIIAIGVSKYEELLSGAMHFSTLPIMRDQEEGDGQFHGVPFVLTQKLTENSVLVL